MTAEWYVNVSEPRNTGWYSIIDVTHVYFIIRFLDNF